MIGLRWGKKKPPRGRREGKGIAGGKGLNREKGKKSSRKGRSPPQPEKEIV